MMSLFNAGAGLITLVASSLSVADLELSQGFSISVYAPNVENARQMALGDKCHSALTSALTRSY